MNIVCSRCLSDGSGRSLNFAVRCHMPQPIRLGPSPLLSVVLSVALAGCFNHSTRVAKALVYHADGKPDDAATTAALNARFPASSKFADLQTFVDSLSGRCGKTQQQERMFCTIPLDGAICVVHVIFLSVTTSSDGTIQHIEAKGGMQAC